MNRKLRFYEQYGVAEYYLYDPVGEASPVENRIDFAGWVRDGDRLEPIEDPHNWISPLLGIRFKIEPDTLEIYRPDGQHR